MNRDVVVASDLCRCVAARVNVLNGYLGRWPRLSHLAPSALNDPRYAIENASQPKDE